MSLSLVMVLALPPVTGALCWAARRPSRVELVHLAGALATLAAGLALAFEVFTGGPVTPPVGAGLFFVDALGALLVAVVAVVCFLAALYSIGYLRHDVETGLVQADQLRNYYAGYHLFVGTMLAVGVINNLGLLWVAVEATTIISALLVGFYRTEAALEAAWKYLILCSVGILFALFGVLLTYYAAARVVGPTAALDWTVLVANAERLDPGLMKLAFVFVLVGFGTKAGFAPLHTWLPDAHSQAPSPISAVLSGVLLNCALYSILRFHLIAAGTLGPSFSSGLLLGFGLLSVAFAIPFMLVQRDIKRLLAYSSVEHIGLIAVAVGIGGPLGLYAGLLHLVNHALTKALLFFVAGELVQRYGTRRMRAIRGVVVGLPLTGPLLLLGGFAITGLPPFGIFVSELGIVGAGFRQGYGLAAAALAAMLALVFTGIFSHVAGMAFGRAAKPLIAGKLHPAGVAAMVLPALGITVLGIYVPSPLTAALQQAVSLFAGGGR